MNAQLVESFPHGNDTVSPDEQAARSLHDVTSKPISKLVSPVAIFDAEGRQRKQADILTDIGRQHVLFRDRDGTVYAQVIVKDHAEVHLIDSRAYREVLTEAFFRLVGKGCNRNAICDALMTLSSLARFEGETHQVWIRVAAQEERLVIDMGGKDWRCMEVDARGWRWCESPPMFRRGGAPLPLPEPMKADFGKLWKYVNVSPEDRPLLAAYMVASLRPIGPYPQLHFSGEQGTGKSTTVRVIKSLIDPSVSQLRAPPKEVRDLLVGALNGWCLALDNMSFLTPQLSDTLCRLATGGAISERQLYTNTDEVLLEVQRPVILNGIEDLATRPDLAERGIHIELQRIEHRKPERQFWAEFKADAPHIFGALLEALSCAIRDYQTIRIERLPRMADFAIWAAAALPSLGFTVDEFLSAYDDNQEAGLSAGVDSSPVGNAVIDLLQVKPVWEGTSSDLLTDLSSKVDETLRRSPAWPRSPRGMSGILRRLAPALRVSGIEVTAGRESNAGRARRFTLCYRGRQASRPSTPSESPPMVDGLDVSDGSDGQFAGCTPADYRRAKYGQ